jgi:uncharacterized protein
MNSLNFLDANVWLALIWNRHAHAERARNWFVSVGDQDFFYCRIIQMTVLRLLTTEKIMRSDVRTMIDAWKLWDEIQSDRRISFLPEPELLEHEFRRQSQLRTFSPKVWADAYLLGFASAAGVKLVTFDRALESRAGDVLVL